MGELYEFFMDNNKQPLFCLSNFVSINGANAKVNSFLQKKKHKKMTTNQHEAL